MSNDAPTIAATQNTPFKNTFAIIDFNQKFSLNDLRLFASTCKQTSLLAKQQIQARVDQLFKAVLWADIDQVTQMLDQCPSLLLQTGVANEFSGRKFNDADFFKKYTAFQAALCTGDATMCTSMAKYFSKIPDGKKIIFEQMKGVFPNGQTNDRNNQKKNIFDFEPIIEKIKSASEIEVKNILKEEEDKMSELNSALDKFRENFKTHTFKDPVFNYYHTLDLINKFENFIKQDVSLEKKILFWRQLIGYVQTFWPASVLIDFYLGFDVSNRPFDKKAKAFENNNDFLKYIFQELDFNFGIKRALFGSSFTRAQLVKSPLNFSQIEINQFFRQIQNYFEDHYNNGFSVFTLSWMAHAGSSKRFRL